jgi:putative ATPase
LAQVIARLTHSRFVALSAVSAGVADLRRVVQQARANRSQRTILFIDEIHRFHKGQQDAVLPFVEDGTVTLIGATTENPSFEVNAALLSRVRVFTLRPLNDDEVTQIVWRALEDTERGLGGMGLTLEPDALRHLVDRAERSRAGRRCGFSQRDQPHQPCGNRGRAPAPRDPVRQGC